MENDPRGIDAQLRQRLALHVNSFDVLRIPRVCDQDIAAEFCRGGTVDESVILWR
jgi:hypothetical protein